MHRRRRAARTIAPGLANGQLSVPAMHGSQGLDLGPVPWSLFGNVAI